MVKLPLLVFAAFVLCPLRASIITFQENRDIAEKCYSEYYEIILKSSITKAEANTALSLITRAYALFPEEFNYVFGLGLIHKYLNNWLQAEQFFREAVRLAPNQAKAEDAEFWLNECSLHLYLIVAKGPIVFEVRFVLKSPTSTNLDLRINTDNPILPKIRPGEDPVALLAYFQKIDSDLMIAKHDVFLLVGPYPTYQLENHYQRGLADVYRVFTKEYFPANNMDYLVVLISEDSRILARIAREIYPNANISIGEPYMGFFCGTDNLIVATIGGGYGTLLHELMHALMAKNMPSSPPWVHEGMAMLYERSAWTTNRLIPLPNWRMDFILNSAAPKLTDFDLIVGRKEYRREDLAAIRLLFLFLEEKSSLLRFLQIQGLETNTQKVSEIITSFGNEYSEKDWQEYAQTTISNYRAELSSSLGTPSYRDTKFIQHALNRIMGAGLKEDGIWGSATVEKVMEFQRKYNLTVDGKVGKLTKEKLEKEFSLKTF
jgi:peptidoglycan hydrolase-like protein with peptidoglycan-binding domain